MTRLIVFASFCTSRQPLVTRLTGAGREVEDVEIERAVLARDDAQRAAAAAAADAAAQRAAYESLLGEAATTKASLLAAPEEGSD